MDRLTIITMRLLLCQYIYNHNVIIPYYYDNMFLQCYVITELLDVIIATSAYFRNRLVALVCPRVMEMRTEPLNK